MKDFIAPQRTDIERYITKCYAYMLAADDAEEAAKWAANVAAAIKLYNNQNDPVDKLEAAKVVVSALDALAKLATAGATIAAAIIKANAYKYGYDQVCTLQRNNEIPLQAATKIVHRDI